MNKKTLVMFLLGLVLGIPARALDFSAIDPRLADSGQNNEQMEEQPQTSVRKSSVFQKKSPETQAPQPQVIPLRSSTVKIVVVVNGEIISTEDIDNRINAFVMTTQIPMNEETKGMIYQKVLTATIDEKLKMQEAKRNKIEVSDKDIDASIASFAEVNKIPLKNIPSLLRKNGISERAFREQMASDIAWLRLIRQKSRLTGEITQKDVDLEMKNALKDFATPKFMVSEIMIKKENAKNLDSLVSILQKDPRFELYAFRFSESPTAANGGKLGWINKESLPAPLAEKLATMKNGEISSPVKVGDDYYIIKLEQSFDPKKDKVTKPTDEDIRRFLENQKTDIFATQYIQSLRQRAVIEFRG